MKRLQYRFLLFGFALGSFGWFVASSAFTSVVKSNNETLSSDGGVHMRYLKGKGDVLSILKSKSPAITQRFDLKWNNGKKTEVYLNNVNNYISESLYAQEALKQIERTAQLSIQNGELPDVKVYTNSGASFGLVGWHTDNGRTWAFRHENKYDKNVHFSWNQTYYKYSNRERTASNPYYWKWVAWFDLGYANQRIGLVENDEYHIDKRVPEPTPRKWDKNKPLWGDIRSKILYSAERLDPDKGIFIWFNQTGFNTKGTKGWANSGFFTDFWDTNNNPNAFTTNITSEGGNSNWHSPDWGSHTTDTRFFLKLEPYSKLFYKENGQERLITVSDYIRKAKSTKTNYQWVNKNQIKTLVRKTRSIDLGLGSAVRQTYTTKSDIASNQQLKYKLKDSTFSIDTYNNFKLDKLLVPKTNEDATAIKNGVFVKQPTLSFDFNPVLTNAIVNIHNLFAQTLDLKEHLKSDQPYNESDKAAINKVIEQIKNKEVDYIQVADFIGKLKNWSQNPGSIESKGENTAQWYADAKKEFGLNLNDDVNTWTQLSSLIASYFSKDIFANVKLNGAKERRMKVWDGAKFEFIPIENTEKQSEQLANENRAEIAVSAIGFQDEGGLRDASFINKVALTPKSSKTKIANGDASKIEKAVNEISYKYHYRQNFKQASWDKQNSQTKSIVVQSTDLNDERERFQKDINNYLKVQGISETEIKVNAVHKVDAMLNARKSDDPKLASVQSTANKYGLNLRSNPYTGQFYVVVDVTNANDLGNQRRANNAKSYFYYIEGLDKGAQSSYLVRFENKQKLYSLESLAVDSRGLYVKNVSKDAIIQAKQNQNLYLDTHNWNAALKANLTNAELTLPTASADNSAKLSTPNAENDEGFLSENVSGSILGYVERMTGKKLFLKERVSFNKEDKNNLKLRLTSNFTLDKKGNLEVKDPSVINQIVEEAKGYNVLVSEEKGDDPESDKNIFKITLTTNPEQSTVIKLPYWIVTKKSKTNKDGTVREQKNLVFDFSNLNNFEYNTVVSLLFTDSSFIKNAYAPLQTEFRKQLKTVLEHKYQAPIKTGQLPLLTKVQLANNQKQIDNFTFDLHKNIFNKEDINKINWPLIAITFTGSAALLSTIIASGVVLHRWRKSRKHFWEQMLKARKVK